jgi:predicted transcriptional regulator
MATTKRKSRRRSTSRRGSSRDNYGQRMFGDVLSLASSLAGSRKQMAAERLNELASATRNLTSSVEDLPYLRDYTDAAAQRIDELADYVERTDIDEMLEDIATFAKRQPMATLALGMAAGLVTTQLMKNWPMPWQASEQTSSNRRRSARR